MAWTHHSKLFVDASGASVANVPRSCIESAEYIIQSISANKLLPWTKAGEARTPHVFARFGDSKSINISDTAEFQNQAVGLKDYGFTSLPAIGQGLICLNNTTKDLGYNMHLGAVVAADTGKILISNMMEPFGKVVKLTALDTIEVTDVGSFRSSAFDTESDKYALGLLTT